jgi:hypothetical protein
MEPSVKLGSANTFVQQIFQQWNYRIKDWSELGIPINFDVTYLFQHDQKNICNPQNLKRSRRISGIDTKSVMGNIFKGWVR